MITASPHTANTEEFYTEKLTQLAAGNSLSGRNRTLWLVVNDRDLANPGETDRPWLTKEEITYDSICID